MKINGKNIPPPTNGERREDAPRRSNRSRIDELDSFDEVADLEAATNLVAENNSNTSSDDKPQSSPEETRQNGRRTHMPMPVMALRPIPPPLGNWNDPDFNRRQLGMLRELSMSARAYLRMERANETDEPNQTNRVTRMSGVMIDIPLMNLAGFGRSGASRQGGRQAANAGDQLSPDGANEAASASQAACAADERNAGEENAVSTTESNGRNGTATLHARANRVDDARLIREVQRTQMLFRRAFSKKPRCFRSNDKKNKMADQAAGCSRLQESSKGSEAQPGTSCEAKNESEEPKATGITKEKPSNGKEKKKSEKGKKKKKKKNRGRKPE